MYMSSRVVPTPPKTKLTRFGPDNAKQSTTKVAKRFFDKSIQLPVVFLFPRRWMVAVAEIRAIIMIVMTGRSEGDMFVVRE
jgi:hypothetical protein